MAKIYCCALLLLAGTFLFAKNIPQRSNAPLPKGYYIVVAAFHSNQEDFAKRYCAKLNEDGQHSKYGFDPTRKLYIVYLDQYSDFNESITQMLKVRKAGIFGEAWVRIIKDGTETNETAEAKIEDQKTQKKAEETKVIENKQVEEKKVEEPKVAEEKKVEENKSVVTEVIENPPAKPVYLPQTLNNTPVFLSLYNSTNNQVIDGDIEVIDTERARLITKVKGNTYVTLPNPGTKSGQLSLISNTFGFRKEQHELSYKNTEGDTLQPYVALIGN